MTMLAAGRPSHFLARTVAWSAAFLGLVGVTACRHPEGPAVQAGVYRDTPEDLHRLWSDILAACQRDERGRVHDLLATLTLTPAELTSLIGPDKASELGSRYQAMMASLCNVGGVELVAQVYEKKYDDVAVTEVAWPTAPPGSRSGAPLLPPSDTDLVVEKALVTPTPFYTVRIKKKSEPSGLRYDFFVYRNGFWRSGNLLGKYLVPPPPLPGAQSPSR